MNEIWFFLENFESKLYWIESIFKFLSFIKKFGVIENLLRFSLIFKRDCFWLFSNDLGKEVKLFFEILIVDRFFRLENKFLEINEGVLFNLIFIV